MQKSTIAMTPTMLRPTTTMNASTCRLTQSIADLRLEFLFNPQQFDFEQTVLAWTCSLKMPRIGLLGFCLRLEPGGLQQLAYLAVMTR